ncbi:MAG TPA: A/G-specific adenine glycosylase [Bryobacteraceae bacterium]|jgi:A/G-specific adenine glycosylase
MLSEADIQQFRRDLLAWFDGSQRDLPWRRTRDPYSIWISEIMLQQTRVTAVLPFYERFLGRFPDFRRLAAAPESELLACWAGLGYYHRARNLQKAAIRMRELDGFPDTYDEIRKLPGTGDYTAAAVASIAFDLPRAAVDGNVLRVASRIFDDGTSTSTASGRKHFRALATLLLDTSRPGAFNQAMMELGATVCLPRKPQCLICPVEQFCEACRNGTQEQRPVRAAGIKSVEEDRVVFWIAEAGKILAWQRPPQSKLMAGFWELPERAQLPSASVGRTLGMFQHGITFHSYRFEVQEAAAPADLGPCEWVSIDALASMPLSTVMRKAKRIADRTRKPVATARSSTASV